MSRTATFLSLVGAVLLAAALTAMTEAADPKAPGDQPPKTEKLEPYECGKVGRLHTFDGIFLASQPQPDDFKHAKNGGIRTVINLRGKDELDWDEASLIKELGMEYHHIPFNSPSALTDDVFNQVRVLLKNRDKRPLLLHCSSANRVGAVWLAYRVLDHGLSYEAAHEEANVVGLKLPAFAAKAKEYIERRQPQSK